MGYRSKKRLGQHFLKSPEIVRRIVEALASGPGQHVIEVGPGRGVLTLPLLESGAEVWGIEFDRDQIGYLSKLTRKFERVHIINDDFLKYEPDPVQLPEFALVGNLPYNITSPVIDWCCNHRERITSAVLMMQHEVAARLAAAPGSKDWSPLSIMTQSQFDVEYLFGVPPESFSPPPRVSSAVVKMTPLQDATTPTAEFERVVKAAFTHRRKQLVNNLVSDLSLTSVQARKYLQEMSLPDNCRAEQLSIAQFLELTAKLLSAKLL